MKKTLLALTALTCLAIPARAQWAVFDGASLGEAILQGQNIVRQMKAAENNVKRLKDNLNRLRKLEFNSISDAQRTIDGALYSANALAYTAADMDRRFGNMFPQAVDDAETSQKLAQVQQTISTMRGTLRGLGRAAAKVEATAGDLSRFKRQVRDSDTPAKQRQVESSLSMYQAQQNAMMQQTLQIMAAQQATKNAYDVQQKREKIMRSQKAIQNMKRIEDPETEGFDGTWSFTQ